MIGLVAVDGSVRPLADELHAAWPDSSKVFKASRGNCFGPLEVLGFALNESERVVCFGPLPAFVRLLCELDRESRGRGVVWVDPQRRYVIPLSGSSTGAEELAREVAVALGVTPVLSDGPVPSGDPHPRPEHPCEDEPVLRIAGPDDTYEDDLVVHPRTLVVGVGVGSGTGTTELATLLADTLRSAGLSRSSVARLATVTGKASHPAVRHAVWSLGWVPVDEHPAQVLAAVPVPNPSAAVGTAVGTASVAEAAALASAPNGRLVVAKRKSATATVAVARAGVRGRLAALAHGTDLNSALTPRARWELQNASAVVGTPGAIEAVSPLLRPGTRRIATGECVEAAVTLAGHGHAVVLIAPDDDTESSVPPGPYDVLRIPGPPLPLQGDPA
ncbi:cobalamin biosynthesis protein [Kitasatospora sp. NPDC001660]